MLALIGFNLFSALFIMLKADKSDPRVVKALTWRVALSISLFVLLMLGFRFGFIVQAS